MTFAQLDMFGAPPVLVAVDDPVVLAPFLPVPEKAPVAVGGVWRSPAPRASGFGPGHRRRRDGAAPAAFEEEGG